MSSTTIRKYDPVVGWVEFDSKGEPVILQDLAGGITTAEDRTDRWALEPEVTTVDYRMADSFWKGCTTPEQGNTSKFVRSRNAIEFGNRKDFCYASEGANGTKYVRFYRPGGNGSHVTITLRTATTVAGFRTISVVAYDNPATGKGRFLWKREVTGWVDLGYDDSYEGVAERLAIRLVTLYGAKVAYECDLSK